ncbi:MAG: DUF721 domain-containing protein [Bacteroidales bacterium]|jgi:GTP1/Obg family GTP-binding protein|nr:DUF721 domain-containing protein [Bacteroidales bacterium]HPY75681.1 DciA family protein [Planctomycetota bacterium]HQB01230.1 DciA family protein [Planctomycetota bacterium]
MKNNEPVALSVILQELFEETGLNLSYDTYKIFQIWSKIIQENFKEHTKPHSFHQNILEVHVDSQTCYYELNQFHKQDLLKKIQALSSEYVKDIRFVLITKDKCSLKNQ